VKGKKAVIEQAAERATYRVDAGSVVTWLGKHTIHAEEIAERTQIPGVAIGLAWTEVGGDILFLEATRMAGEKGFTVTGQLGDVMKESAQAAMSWVRNQAPKLGFDVDFFKKSDIHLHIPAGAIPKDGPSAGITMATALASLMTGRLVRPMLGMTGEITLRGKVLPIGGLKEKVLAADRYGLTTLIVPRRNEADLDDVPSEIRKNMTIHLVDTMDEVLALALLPEGADAAEVYAEAIAEVKDERDAINENGAAPQPAKASKKSATKPAAHQNGASDSPAEKPAAKKRVPAKSTVTENSETSRARKPRTKKQP
jgi:ATP-dependent Lon protease